MQKLHRNFIFLFTCNRVSVYEMQCYVNGDIDLKIEKTWVIQMPFIIFLIRRTIIRCLFGKEGKKKISEENEKTNTAWLWRQTNILSSSFVRRNEKSVFI